jgi:hypothetical protein
MNSRDESRIFDVRVLERNLRKGVLTRKDYDKHLKALPDAADKATACNPESQREAPVRHHEPRLPVTAVAPTASLDDEGIDDEDLDEDEDDEDDEDEGEGEGDK